MNTFTDREWGEGTEDPKLFDPTDFDAGPVGRSGPRRRASGASSSRPSTTTASASGRAASRSTRSRARRGRAGRATSSARSPTACRKGGLKFGVYLSPWDRHEPTYGDSPRYNEHFKNQLRELLTQYGEISEVWFDGACGEGPNGKRQVYDWAGYFALIRELQPGAVISIMGPDARWIGNEAGVTRESEWSVIPVVGFDDLPDETNPGGIAHLDAQAKDLGSFGRIAEVAEQGGRLLWYPGQVDVSIRPGWFYHAAEDDKVKTLDQLLDIYYTSVGGNAQLLLNIPPDKRGRIHENDARRLKELGDRLRATFAVNLAEGAKTEMVFDYTFVRWGRRAWTPDRVFEAGSRCLLMCPRRGEILQYRRAHGGHQPGAACRSVRSGCLGWGRSGDRPQPSRADGLAGDRQGDDHRLEEASPVPDSHRGMGPRADPEVPKLFIDLQAEDARALSRSRAVSRIRKAGFRRDTCAVPYIEGSPVAGTVPSGSC